MERRQLEYFIAVAESGNFTRAAERLYVSQPTISAALRTLEAELGGLLFERHQGGVLLTSAGRALLEPARQALSDFKIAGESVRSVLGVSDGTLHVKSVPALSTGWLTTVLPPFRRRYPGVHIRIDSETDDTVIAESVRSGGCDVGLAVTVPSRRGLVTTRVGFQELQAVLPPGSPRDREPITIEELSTHDLISLSGNRAASRRWFEEQLQERGLEPRIPIEVGSFEGLLPLVVEGLGFVLWWSPLPETMMGPCAMRPVENGAKRPINLLLREGPMAPATLAFLDCAGVGATMEPAACPVDT